MDSSQHSVVVGIVMICFLLVAGVWFTYFPDNIRKQAMGKNTDGLFSSAMKTDLYMYILRAGGSLAFIVSGVLIGLLFSR